MEQHVDLAAVDVSTVRESLRDVARGEARAVPGVSPRSFPTSGEPWHGGGEVVDTDDRDWQNYEACQSCYAEPLAELEKQLELYERLRILYSSAKSDLSKMMAAGDMAPKPHYMVDSAWQAQKQKINAWSARLGIAERKDTIAQKGPVVAGMAVFEDFSYYRSGVYRHVSGVLRGYHAVSVVGYDDARGCWIAWYSVEAM